MYPVLGREHTVPLFEDTLLARFARYEEMDQYPETCLHGDSLVHTVNGPVAIRDLVGTQPYIFSFDLESGEVVLDQAATVVKTGEDLEIVRVVLDNGRILRVTPNHRFLSRDGEYIEAGNLQLGQSLMPFRSRIGRTDYMEVFQPGRPAKSRSKRWEFMYRVVSRWKHGRDAVFGEAVHHDDLCRLNDHPDNLLLITSDEHTRIHAEHINRMGLKAEWTDEMRAKAAERMRGNTFSHGLKHSEESRRKMSEARRGVLKSPEHRRAIGLAQPTRIHLDPERLDQMIRDGLNVSQIAQRFCVSWSTAKRRIAELHGDYRGHDRRIVNCKVLRVESAGRADVYDLQAPRCQNFAAEGVFVHNSLVLDLYADDATVRDQIRHHTMWAQSQDKAIEGILDDTRDRLNAEHDAWVRVRNLCKYGNTYGELLVTGDPPLVRGINYLPTATMRRVEDRRGTLLGFYQIEAGRVANMSIRPDDFQQMLQREKQAGALDKPYTFYGGGVPGDVPISHPGSPGNVILFEPAEVVHWRLRRDMRGMYGLGVLESADWVWRRLRMLEDAVLVHKLCLRGDSKVWTFTGYKEIRDIEEGEEVYSFGHDERLKKSRVIYKKHNGTDRVFRVHSRHRELFANATHPVLVETIEHHGKGIPRTRRLDYVEVQDLEPRKHRFVTPSLDNEEWEDVPLRVPEVGRKASLTQEAVSNGVCLRCGVKKLKQDCGIDVDRMKSFFCGEYELVEHTARKLLEANGYDPDGLLHVRDDWGGASAVKIPQYVTPDFARWWGFMLGDGFLATRNHKDGYVAANNVGFALGHDDEINQFYKDLFESFVGPVRFDQDDRLGSYSVYSKPFFEFMEMNGFVPGAHEKRLPWWVFRARPSIKLALIQGLVDADGHSTPFSVSPLRRRIRYEHVVLEMCNRWLLEDVRELAMQVGLVVGHKVRKRQRKGGHVLDKESGRTMPSTTSYTLDMTFKAALASEVILGVEEVEADDIWDIGVEAEEHNFVVNGVVVHNTRAPGRYAFYVNAGSQPPEKALAYVNRIKGQYKKRKFINPTTGDLDTRFNPLSVDEDFWIPIIKGEEQSRIDVLSGPDYQGMDEVEFFLKKLYTAVKIPRQYMDFAENMNKSLLSSDDVRFARAVMRVQNAEIEGWNQVGATQLFLLGYDLEKVGEWGYRMSTPSAIFELAMVEVLAAKADLASRMQEFVSVRWIMQHIFGWADDEIDQVFDEWAEERLWKSIIESMGAAEGSRIQADADLETEKRRAEMEQEASAGTEEERRAAAESSHRMAMATLDRKDRQQASRLAEEMGRNIRRLLEEGNRESEKRMEGKLAGMMANHGNEISQRFRALSPFMHEVRMALRTTRRGG